MKSRVWCWLLPLIAAGCFYPPLPHGASAPTRGITLPLPFDLAWDAVNTVVKRDDFDVIRQDPDEGVIETQAVGGFTLADADCGRLKGVAGEYAAQPDADSSAVFNIRVEPSGNQASTVSVQGIFTTPLHVPLHPVSDTQCASRGVRETQLLNEIAAQGKNEHRPRFRRPSG